MGTFGERPGEAMKWPEKIEEFGGTHSDVQQAVGFNRAIDAWRAALNEACSRENLAIIIKAWAVNKWDGYDNEINKLADGIRKHLGLEDKSGMQTEAR